MNRFKIH